ncbi:hypothetical protein AB0H00_08540 [Nocardia sp. NPDC023852]|uniref:hypothetical protein n=1 Tax=Nocardia sp. NPDC023852 TaxID=3154697 RepID=UPI0033DA8FC4
MANDTEPLGIRQSHIDGARSIIGAYGWPYSPEENAELLENISGGQSLELPQQVSAALRALTRKPDGTR